MARQLTVNQAVQALFQFEKNVGKAVIRGLETGVKIALKISNTKFFQGGQGQPNPPPGPLKIRSGTLWRGTTIIPAVAGPGDTWVSGLENAISYAKFHERPGGRPFLAPALKEAEGLTLRAIEVELQEEALRALG